MSSKTEKPYVLRVAEFIYLKINEIKIQNPEINNIQAFEIFMSTKDYDFVSSGEFHNKWLLELKNNDFIDNKTDKKKPKATNANLKARAANGSLLSIIGFVVIKAEDQRRIKMNGKILTILILQI